MTKRLFNKDQYSYKNTTYILKKNFVTEYRNELAVFESMKVNILNNTDKH